MHIFWSETDPWLARPSAARRFCEHAGLATRDFFLDRDLVSHAAGRFLLLEGYRRYTGKDTLPSLRTAPGGKPYFEGGEPFFSISHAGTIALCAFAGAEVGVDVEEVGAVEDELLNALRPEERTYLRQVPEKDREMAFYRLWTQKESLVKASGEGLGAILELESVITPALEWKTQMNGFGLHRLSFLEPGYAVCVSIKAEEPLEITHLELPQHFDIL